MFSEMPLQVNGGAAMTLRCHGRRTQSNSGTARYGTVCVTASLKTGGPAGRNLMSTGRKIRCYDYVNHPYERVRDALRQNALTVFQSATKAAASRAQSVAAELHVDFAGIGVKTDIKISVKSVEEKAADAASAPSTRLLLEWEAATMPRLVSAHEGRAFRLSADLDRNAVGFLRSLRTTFRRRGKDHERDRRPPHRRGVGASLR